MIDDFRGMTSSTVHNGNSVSLRYDKWDIDGKKEIQYPRLLSFAKNNRINMHEATSSEDIYDLFQLPLPIEAHQELRDLQLDLNGIVSSDQYDTWSFSWSEAFFPQRKFTEPLLVIMKWLNQSLIYG
jgi:hypothetical protein